jgi:hypothetical protein
MVMSVVVMLAAAVCLIAYLMRRRSRLRAED